MRKVRKEIDMFDVIEISKILGVSDKTVYRYFKKYDSQMEQYILRNRHGNKALSKKGLEKLSKLVNKEIELPDENENDLILQELRKQIQELKDDKKYLREQNKELKENITNLTRLLDQEQQLRLHSIKQLEEPTEENQEDIEDRATEKSFFKKMIDKIR